MASGQSGILSGTPLRQETSARTWLASTPRAIGLALLILLVWRILFQQAPSFILLGTAVGVAGLLDAWLTGNSLRTPIDGPLLIYVLLALVSALVHHGHFAPTLAKNEPLTAWQPALRVVAVTIYFYGASRLLASERRISLLLGAIVVSVSLFGGQAFYDHVRQNLAARLFDYPSLTRWTGYTPLGLLFAIALALSLPVIVVPGLSVAVWAASVVSLVFLADIAAVYSRTATASAAAAYGVAGLIEFSRWKGVRLLAAGAAALTILVAVSLAGSSALTPMTFVRGDFYSQGANATAAYRYRLVIWNRALGLVKAHPWLGVGPGNYSDAMRQQYAAVAAIDRDYYPHYIVHAHNMLLHVAAENGVPAALAFLMMWRYLAKRLIEASDRSHRGMLALAVFGALVVFFVKGLFEHLLTGLDVSTRIDFLLWTLVAAAAAISRLTGVRPTASRRSEGKTGH